MALLYSFGCSGIASILFFTLRCHRSTYSAHIAQTVSQKLSEIIIWWWVMWCDDAQTVLLSSWCWCWYHETHIHLLRLHFPFYWLYFRIYFCLSTSMLHRQCYGIHGAERTWKTMCKLESRSVPCDEIRCGNACLWERKRAGVCRWGKYR